MLDITLWIMIFLLSGLAVFHALVLITIVPCKMVWGASMNADRRMYVMESVALLLTLYFLGVTMIKAGILSVIVPKNTLSVTFWSMAILFSLSTLGNLFSKNPLERLIFSPLSAALTVLSFIVIFAS